MDLKIVLRIIAILLTFSCAKVKSSGRQQGSGNFVLSIDGYFVNSTLSLTDVASVLHIIELAVNSSDNSRKRDNNNRMHLGIFSINPARDSLIMKRRKLDQLKRNFRDAVGSKIYDNLIKNSARDCNHGWGEGKVIRRPKRAASPFQIFIQAASNIYSLVRFARAEYQEFRLYATIREIK